MHVSASVMELHTYKLKKISHFMPESNQKKFITI